MDELPPDVRAAMEREPLQAPKPADAQKAAPLAGEKTGAPVRAVTTPPGRKSFFSRFTRQRRPVDGKKPIGPGTGGTADQADKLKPKLPSRVGKSIRRPTSPIQALEPRPAPAPAGSRFGRNWRSTPKIPTNPKDKTPMRRSGGFVGFAYTFSTLAFLFAVAGTVIYYGKVTFDGEGPLTGPVAVVIEKGTGLSGMASELERQGVIDDANIFVAGVIISGKQGAMKAGEYAIPAGASMARVMTILSEGKAIQFKVTIAEGLTSAQVVEILNSKEDLTGAIDQIPPEGSLLPETYSYPRRTPRQEIINQMQRAQATVLADLWASRAPGLPLKTPEEAVILASIVEKETGQPGERRQVASVFINRLKRNMRLQSDPTIIYGITGGKGPLGRAIFQSDIDKPTEYNTYQINGLPPTPIANPGRAALQATLDPDSTNFLFFVADGTGGHAFAATLAEHTSNVARWRQIERRARLEAEKAAAAGADGNKNNNNPQGGGTIETQVQDLVLPGQ